jgi:archaellum component FlaC
MDVDTVVLKARVAKRSEKTAGHRKTDGKPDGERHDRETERELVRRLDTITARIEDAENRIEAIDETFSDPAFYDSTARDDVRELQAERSRLRAEVEELMTEWEDVERRLGQL